MTDLLDQLLGPVAQAADPEPLGGVDVCDHRSLLGARAADHAAALAAAVPTLGHAELVGAARADGRGLVREPGPRSVAAALALQQFGAALLHVLYPGPLLLVGGCCYVEGLVQRVDQPLVCQPGVVLQVLQLDVLWNEQTTGV